MRTYADSIDLLSLDIMDAFSSCGVPPGWPMHALRGPADLRSVCGATGLDAVWPPENVAGFTRRRASITCKSCEKRISRGASWWEA